MQNLAATNATDPRASRPGPRRNVRNPNRRIRRGSRLAVAAAVAFGGLAAGAGTAAAESVSGSHEGDMIETHQPATGPVVNIPKPTVPNVKDALGKQIQRPVGDHLPEGYEFPDDDADPEMKPTDDGGEDEYLSPLDPGELERVHPEVLPERDVEVDNGDGNDCDNPDFAAKYPEKCGDDDKPEINSCDDEKFAAEYPEKCPGDEVPGDDPTDECTDEQECTEEPGDDPEVTTTTVETERPEAEVEGETYERADGELAFTGSNLVLPLVGAGLLAAGAVAAGVSLSAKRRGAETGTEA